MKVLVAALCMAFAFTAPPVVEEAIAGDWKPLISPVDAAAIADEALLIDIRGKAYAAGHPEGAVHTPYGLWRGPKDNPGEVLSDERLTTLLRNIGADRERATVVVWQGRTQTGFGGAARVYWTLKSAGFTRIAVLDGGVDAWIGSKLKLTTARPDVTPGAGDFTLSDEWRARRDDVVAISTGAAEGVLLDARPQDFLSGKKKHKAALKAGTIAGAEGFAHFTWFATKKPVLGGGGLLDKFRKPEGDGPIVSFCNTGHWAATNWFMLSEVKGIEGVKLYPESMVGWTRDGQATVTR